MKILIAKPGGIGDTLLLLPALIELRRTFGEVEIDVAGNREVLSLFENTGIISRAINFEDRLITQLFSPRPNDRARSFLVQYDKLFFLIEDDDIITENLNAVSTDYIITSSVQKKKLLPQWKYLAIIMGLSTVDEEFYRDAFSKSGEKGKANRITIHPGSGSKSKRWPLERFIGLIEQISHKHPLQIELLTGYAEEDISPMLLKSDAIIDTCTLHHNEPLSSVLQLIQESLIFIGNDSGIAHLAGLSGTPSIVLFGPSNPIVWKPLGKNISIILPDDGSKNIGNISIRRVVEELDNFFRRSV
jgi:heptosyltransferase-3